MNADLRWQQIQYALPVFGNKSIHENESLNFSRLILYHTTDNHACITVAYKDDFLQSRQYIRNVIYMLAQRNIGRQVVLVGTEPDEHRCNHLMALLF